MSGRQRPTSFVDGSKSAVSSHSNLSQPYFSGVPNIGKDKSMTVIATIGLASQDKQQEISFIGTKPIGNGSFGVVYQAKCVQLGEMVAIKKVLQDRRFKNRELQIMRKLDHINIVKLLYFFYSSGDKKDEVYLNLVLEFIPETVYRVARQYSKNKQTMPLLYIKLYMYQLFRSLSYMHQQGICHRDIKPQNLLLNPDLGILKLCDFGSAKQLVKGEPNVSYICSRYYRAPELIFGASDYTPQIDVWSAGCVVAELLLGQPIFPGDSGVDQLVEIIKVLGTPSKEQIRDMNPSYQEFKFPHIRPHPWSKVFRTRTPTEALEIVNHLLDYTPTKRLLPIEACAHHFFDELRTPSTKLSNGSDLPVLFNFSSLELRTRASLTGKLIPPHIKLSASFYNSANNNSTSNDFQSSNNTNPNFQPNNNSNPNFVDNNDNNNPNFLATNTNNNNASLIGASSNSMH